MGTVTGSLVSKSLILANFKLLWAAMILSNFEQSFFPNYQPSLSRRLRLCQSCPGLTRILVSERGSPPRDLAREIRVKLPHVRGVISFLQPTLQILLMQGFQSFSVEFDSKTRRGWAHNASILPLERSRNYNILIPSFPRPVSVACVV